MGSDEYAPPPGAPPSYTNDNGYRPPPGPPPPQNNAQYAAPPGPPPSHQNNQGFAPPPGPPPSHGKGKDTDPPPYQWTDVEDTSLLPPPPAINQLHGFSNVNASADSAEKAVTWCRMNPLYGPMQLSTHNLDLIRQGSLSLLQPPNLDAVMISPQPGTTHVRSGHRSEDTLLLTDLPLFASFHANPAKTGKHKTIYYEISIKSIGQHVESGIAIGYVAPPYPPWRLPGWQRGSMSVMSDDGRRYIDDDGGGQDFTQPFSAGETVGLGVVFRPPRAGTAHNDVRVFFTRNGKETDGFDLFEMRDQHDYGTIFGLEGSCDLLGAVGFYGQVEFEVHFRPDRWIFRPEP